MDFDLKEIAYISTTEGLFEFWWKGETLYARNTAVGGS